MLDLRNLETFVWVWRLGGFRAAAERLNTTQPAISARIALLERDLGTRVFDRRARRIVLTVKGAELLGYAERMLALRADMLRAVGETASLRGNLRIGIPETIVHTWLAELVDRISAAYPSVSLDIDVDSSINLRAGLLAERIDLAFVDGELVDSALKTEPLCSYTLEWFAGEKVTLPRRVRLSDVVRWPIITFRRTSRPYRAVRKLLAESNLGDARVFGSSSIAATVRMALDGIGVCVLPAPVVAAEVAAGALRRLTLTEALPPIQFYTACLAKPDNHLAESVAEIAVATARAHHGTTPDGSKFPIG